MAKGNWRDDLDRDLRNIMKTKGPDAFLQTATAMLSVRAGDTPEFKALFVGQVCETVLTCLTRKYLDATGIEAKVFPSVVLKDLRNKKSEFRTELDCIIASPGVILTTECKSFSGGIVIKPKCTLVHRGKESDVYRQSRLHYDTLKRYCEELVLPNKGIASPPVYANAFVFSNAEIQDQRRGPDKDYLRVLTTSDIFDYYDRLFNKFKEPVYDYERACKIFGTCSRSKKLHVQHGEYVGYSD